MALAGCAGKKEGSSFHGYKPIDRTSTCVGRWNDWLAALDPSSFDHGYIERSRALSDAVTVIGVRDTHGPQINGGETTCGVILWARTYSAGTAYVNTYTNPKFVIDYATIVHEYPASGPNKAISDVRMQSDGSLTYPDAVH